MSEPEIHDRWDRVKGWIEHASEDVRIARGCLGLDPPALGGAAYHCQQAVEKVLKGFLVLAGIDFRRTHDLTALGKLVLSHFPSLQSILRIDSRWTAWGVVYR
jgi:HEPN domain-containing protein